MLFIHFLTDVIYIFTSHMAEVDVATLWYDCTCRQSWFLMRRTRAKNRNLFGSASPGSPAHCPTSDLQESAGDGCPASSPAGGSFRRTTERLKLLKKLPRRLFPVEMKALAAATKAVFTARHTEDWPTVHKTEASSASFAYRLLQFID